MSIAIWSIEEKAILDNIMIKLEQERREDEREQVQKITHSLEIQAWAIGLYPSIIDSNRLAGKERNIETLVTSLCEKYPFEGLLSMPSKAVTGRSFIIAKINLFYMVLMLLRDDADAKDLETRVRACILDCITGVLTEEVLMELIGYRSAFSPVSQKAARMLAAIWEYRTDPSIETFNPALAHLWIARRKSLPIYGTLLGIHEFIRLEWNVDMICRDYILHAADNSDETDALEEFLFGVCYEDLALLKREMAERDISCINRSDVTGFLGRDSVFLCGTDDDPLELYRFFNMRRNKAFARRNSFAKGPIRTFEENFLSYLLMKSIESEKTAILSQCKET